MGVAALHANCSKHSDWHRQRTVKPSLTQAAILSDAGLFKDDIPTLMGKAVVRHPLGNRSNAVDFIDNEAPDGKRARPYCKSRASGITS